MGKAYRTAHYLDKIVQTREAIEIMTAVVPIGIPSGIGSPAERVGVLLVNLGTPDTADARAWRVYLKEFLSSPRVIEDQGLRWKLILNGIILRVRPAARRATTGRSGIPRETNPRSRRLRARRPKSSRRRLPSRPRRGRLGDAYGQPVDPLAHRCADRAGLRPVAVVPLYPQYSAATSATVCDEAFRVLADARAADLRVARLTTTIPDYIEGSRSHQRASRDLAVSARTDRGVVSRHAAEICRQGDPYYDQCVATTESLRKRLALMPQN